MTETAEQEGGFWAKVGLGRPELRAWALYDWANSAFFTTIIAAVYPIYYQRVVAADLPDGEGFARYAAATTIAMAIVAVLAPILGSLGDAAGIVKRLFVVFLLLGVASTATMFTVERGDVTLASLLLIGGTVGVGGSFVFYDAFLPHIARPGEMDRVSTSGYALGYMGGGLLLALNLWWIQNPGAFGLPAGDDLTPSEATLPSRLAFLSVAIWWLVFSIPMLRRVKEPRHKLEPDEQVGDKVLRRTFQRLGETIRELRSYKQAFLMLLAVLLYGDGIGTIIKMASTYGAERGVPESAMISALLIIQFVGIPFALFFGWLSGKIGPKASIMICLTVYVGVCFFAYSLETARDFYVMAFAVGTVQGGAQALGRSTFASMIPQHKAGEFFGLYVLGDKFAGVLGPGLIWLVTLVTGRPELAVPSVVVFFIAGAIVLSRVRVDEGREVARAAEALLHDES